MHLESEKKVSTWAALGGDANSTQLYQEFLSSFKTTTQIYNWYEFTIILLWIRVKTLIKLCQTRTKIEHVESGQIPPDILRQAQTAMAQQNNI